MTLQEQRDVIQAALDGKALQFRRYEEGHPWQDAYGEVRQFDFQHFAWRVKPEPREWWVNIYSGGDSGCLHPTKEAAREATDPNVVREVIHVREVLD